MKQKWLVETRATVIRHRYVMAENPKEAEELSCSARIVHEEDENEETITVTPLPP